MTMRTMLGLAAMLSALALSAPAYAVGCPDYRNSARQTSDVGELNRLLRLARECDEDVQNFIRGRIAEEEAAAPPSERSITLASLPFGGGPRTPVVPADPSGGGATAPPAPPAPLANEPVRLVLNEQADASIDASADLIVGEFIMDRYTIRLAADQGIEVAVQADDLAPFVFIGTGRAPENFFVISEGSPESETDVDASVRFVAPEDNEYGVIVVSGLEQQRGPYAINARHFSPPAPPTPQALTIGRRAPGSLSAASAVLYSENGQPYELWQFTARGGETLKLSMTAPAGSSLDPFLEVGRMVGGRFERLDYNDDRGDGTLNSMLRFIPPEAGDYVVRARAYLPQQYGEYTLLVVNETP